MCGDWLGKPGWISSILCYFSSATKIVGAFVHNKDRDLKERLGSV